MWIGSDLVVHRQEVSHELEPLNYLIDPPPILSGSLPMEQTSKAYVHHTNVLVQGLGGQA